MARALKIDDSFVCYDDEMKGRLRAGSERSSATPAALFLSYAAAAPLVAAALLIVAYPAYAEQLRDVMALYGAALIVFFGGVRWGVAVMRAEGPTFRSLLGAVIPLFLALPLFLSGASAWKLLAIMALTAALLADDLNATRRGSGAPAWYLSVRLPLTVLIEVAMVVALLA